MDERRWQLSLQELRRRDSFLQCRYRISAAFLYMRRMPRRVQRPKRTELAHAGPPTETRRSPLPPVRASAGRHPRLRQEPLRVQAGKGVVVRMGGDDDEVRARQSGRARLPSTVRRRQTFDLAGGGEISVVIDRCNFDVDQRRTWIELAREMNADCECVVFDYDTDVCIERCRARRGHETIRPSEAAGIVSEMARRFRSPGRGERFRRIVRVSSFRMADDLVEHYLGRT
ncbi:hypothetical protein ACHAW5_002033 [Stephanodiscus triporus]|uniref:Uncharacterized protein n=1 Tax=Stephanodiscus triporus TaxID=2934178 RepID=A0ABD3QL22_9STRA